MVATNQPQGSGWLAKSKFAMLGYAIFFGPALVIPAFVHQQMPMRGWVYFAWLFCTPVACIVGNIGKGRSLKFYVGLLAALLPVELVWYLAYTSCFATPDRKTVAIIYIPLITLISFIFVPIGGVMTYQATHEDNA